MSGRAVFVPPGDAAARAAFAALGERAGLADTDPLDGALALALLGPAAAPVARASLWLADDLVGAPGRSGLIGHYEALAAEDGVELLRAACEELGRRGVRRVLGPMNGTTWHRYRLELPRDPGDPDVRPVRFGSEPRNPQRYPGDFAAAGFAVAAHYESRYEPEPVVDAHAHDHVRQRALAHGIRLHALESTRFDDTLRGMHALSLGAFADNPYYAPLPLAAFLALYAPYRERVVPGLVRLATRDDGRLAGYLFGFPDPLSVVAGRPERTVCKTVAVAPDARGAGLGGLLLDDFRAASLACGARGIVHALMHVDNVSMRMSARHHSLSFKRYALYEWTP